MRYTGKKLICAIAAMNLLTGCVSEQASVPDPTPTAAPLTAESRDPVYPELLQYPMMEDYMEAGRLNDTEYDKALKDWLSQQRELQNESREYLEAVYQFTDQVSEHLLNVTDDSNRIYSPLNLYIALGMLCETTEGNTRAQILDLLNVKDNETLRQAVPALWKANYSDSDAVTSILSNSLWLDEKLNCKEEFRQILADCYYASSFTGDLDSEECMALFRSWLNQSTGNLLKDQINEIELDRMTVMVLASAIYYRAKWASEFNEDLTAEEIFHSPTGDITCEMMHSSRMGNVYYGDHFSAVPLYIENSGQMWIVLPDEDTSVQDIMKDPAVREMLRDPQSCSSGYAVIEMTIPKLDVMSDVDLKNQLTELGITDVFDPELADYSPVSDETLVLDQARHAARLKTDEEGIEAAAYTVLATNATAAFTDGIFRFTVDRPFFFSLQAADGSPLFEGVVNHPQD